MPNSRALRAIASIWRADIGSAGSSFVGTLWSIVASVRSGRRTRRFARRRPSKACGLVTSWTRCRSTYRRSGSPGTLRTTCRSQTFWLSVLPTRKVWSLREPIEGATKPPHAFVDAIRGRRADREAQCAPVIGVDGESVAGDERDAFLQGDVEQGSGAQLLRQAHPEVEAALGIVPGDSRPGQLARERGARSVLLLAIEVAQQSDVRVGTASPVELEDDALGERAGARVHGLLSASHPRDDQKVSYDPADPKARKERLRERADRHDLGTAERGKRRHVVTAIAQPTVGIVLDHHRVVARGEREEGLAALERKCLAGRVLKVRNDEEHARAQPELPDPTRGLRHIEALSVNGDLEHA